MSLFAFSPRCLACLVPVFPARPPQPHQHDTLIETRLLYLSIPTFPPPPKVRRAFRVLCRTSLSVTTSMVSAVRAGTPPEDILADALDTEYPGAAGGGMAGGSGRHGSSSVSGGGRNRRAGGGTEGGRYPALVDRALGTLMKVRQTSLIRSVVGPFLLCRWTI